MSAGRAPVSGELLASLEAQYRGVDVESPLRDTLRRLLDAPGLDFAGPLEPLLGGTETWIFGFSLAGAPAGWRGPLVLRMARDDVPDVDLRFEAAVQNAVAAQGYPAPRVMHVEGEGGALGRPFLVMERVPGEAGPGGLFAGPRGGTLGLLAGVPRLLTRLPRLQAEALLRLHALDPERILRALDDAGLPRARAVLDARLGALAREAAAARDCDLDALLRWLHAHRPAEPERPCICHGDFHAFNLLFAPGRLTGVIDWTGACVADPALDLGVVRAQLRISQLPVAGVPGRVVHAAQRRLLRAFERRYARGRAVDARILDWFELLPCAVALARMHARRGRADREPLAELAWEHPRALARLRERVRAVAGIELRLPADYSA